MTDEELCRAILETEQGKADVLGGGVFKKRLHQNRERAIILAKGGSNWFYTFLYAKQDMSNINSQELAGFRELAKHYAFLTKAQLTAMSEITPADTVVGLSAIIRTVKCVLAEDQVIRRFVPGMEKFK